MRRWAMTASRKQRTTSGPGAPLGHASGAIAGLRRVRPACAWRLGMPLIHRWILLTALCWVSSVSVAGAGVNVWTSNGPEGGLIQVLAIDPVTPSILYAGTGGSGIFKSTDSGENWSAANTGLSSPIVSAFAIDPATPTTVYAGTLGGGVFKSTDSGAHWS